MHAFKTPADQNCGSETKNMGSCGLCAGAKRVFFLKLDIDTVHCTEVCLLRYTEIRSLDILVWPQQTLAQSASY